MFRVRTADRTRSAAGLLLALALAAGCRSFAGEDDEGNRWAWRRRVGLVVFFSGVEAPDPLVAPAEAARGAPFSVTVTTYGSSSCTRPSGGEVRYESGGTVAVVTPYDEYLEGENVGCTADLRAFPRPLALRFDAAGTARIRLVARAQGLGVGDSDTPTLITEREIAVR